ncbi:rho GTPase-activating protein gacU-like [Condylostylus longicornis]|uniref:rho GTPase-activating protein gacU-like n=1 Tax=Condylostylus longicornis TaxID=2530218 RepID=UPI00244DBC85|nr:rho GTPase-activating protein gacU-like [Condylostylus longicornis]
MSTNSMTIDSAAATTLDPTAFHIDAGGFIIPKLITTIPGGHHPLHEKLGASAIDYTAPMPPTVATSTSSINTATNAAYMNQVRLQLLTSINTGNSVSANPITAQSTPIPFKSATLNDNNSSSLGTTSNSTVTSSVSSSQQNNVNPNDSSNINNSFNLNNIKTLWGKSVGNSTLAAINLWGIPPPLTPTSTSTSPLQNFSNSDSQLLLTQIQQQPQQPQQQNSNQIIPQSSLNNNASHTPPSSSSPKSTSSSIISSISSSINNTPSQQYHSAANSIGSGCSKDSIWMSNQSSPNREQIFFTPPPTLIPQQQQLQNQSNLMQLSLQPNLNDLNAQSAKININKLIGSGTIWSALPVTNAKLPHNSYINGKIPNLWDNVAQTKNNTANSNIAQQQSLLLQQQQQQSNLRGTSQQFMQQQHQQNSTYTTTINDNNNILTNKPQLSRELFPSVTKLASSNHQIDSISSENNSSETSTSSSSNCII